VERELVEQAQRGDQDAFAALVELTADRLYSIAYRMLRDPARADDALQNALIAMWQRLPELRDPDRFEAWTYRMIVRASYREFEQARSLRARVRRLSVSADEDCDGQLERIASRDELDRAFRELTPEHRAVLVLRHFVGLPIAVIAESLEIPVGTAASRLHYATRCLRAAFEADARGVVAWRHPA
jgi:RNA polymerase sigma-70 factor (ECF subfamily)